MSAQNATPEMGKYLRQIVDNYLEEGQFDSGVAMLDQIRSPDHKPSIIHILHLVFIALHSAAHVTRLDEPGTDPVYDPATLLLQSPRKIVKQSKSALVLSPDTIVASQRLLYAFISTNSPSDIATALPHYPDNEIRRQVNVEGEGGAHFGFDYLDSPVYNQAAAIRNSRSVWDILKEGYSNRAMQIFGTPKARSKGKSLKGRSLGRESSFNVKTEIEELNVVGKDSWFLLEWLVALYEKDALLAQSEGLVKHSRLLLRQLPPPPINTVARWDASEPLKVVAYSLQQPDSRRKRIGLRLLNLLIDLSQTPYLNLSSLASSTLAQIASSSAFLNKSSPNNSPSSSPANPHQTPDIPNGNCNPLVTLFDSLSSTLPSLAFKISLCQKILQGSDCISTAIPPKANGQTSAKSNNADPSQSSSTANSPPLVSALKRPKPTPRIAPRPRGAAAATSTNQENETTAPLQSTLSEESAVPLTSLSKDATNLSDAVPPSALVPATPAPPPRQRLPAFIDIALLLKAQLESESLPNEPSRPRVRQRNTNARNTPQTPWSAPGLRLRVKFELLHACTTLAKRTRSELASNEAELAARTDVQDWREAVSDGRMHELLLVAFGPQMPTSREEEAQDKAFYADIIKATVGLPIEAT